MSRFKMIVAASALSTVALMNSAAYAQEGGPCSDDIAKLKRELGMQVGMGAPVSQPDTGQRKGPNDGSAGQSAGTTGSMTKPAENSETGSDGQGGASKMKGGSPGTVGGVSGTVAAATGSGQADSVASGRIATSPADVRAQSENKPTAAVAASKGGEASASPSLSPEDKVSQAKTALQRATDLNAKGDQSCRDAVQQARSLMPQQGR